MDDKKKCGVCGRLLIQDPKPTVLYGWPVDKACSKSFNQKRLNAIVVDIVLAHVFLGLVLFLGPSSHDTAPDGSAGISMIPLIVAGVFLLTKDAWRGRSPGKRMFGLQVVDADTGQPIGLRQSLQRNLVLLLALVGFLPIAEGPVKGFGLTLWVIAYRMRFGPRDGEGWAHTRVILPDHSRSPAFAVIDVASVRTHSRAA